MDCPQGVSKVGKSNFFLLVQWLQTNKKRFLEAKQKNLSIMSLMGIPRTGVWGVGGHVGGEIREKGGQRSLQRPQMHFPAGQPRVTDFFSLRYRIQKEGAKPWECVFVASEARSCQGLWFGCGMSNGSLFSSIISA